MHMSDALISPAVGGAFWAGTIGAISWSSRKLRDSMDERMIPLMGVLGAFIFASQMINFTVPGTGSSGHLSGGMILAVILGPYAAFIVMASVLTIQAFFFADGGLLALGCNVWNLGIYPCFIAYPLIYKPMVQAGSSPKRIVTASVICGVVALQLGAFSVVLETLLSGRSELPFGAFLFLMQPVHLAIGLVEGFVSAGVINFVKAARPEIIEGIASSRPLAADLPIRRVLAGLLIAALITGGMLSWFASANPDGLEWSIEKVFGRKELPEPEQGITPALKSLQDRTTVLPDYTVKKDGNKEETAGSDMGDSWPSTDAFTSISGVVGSLSVLGLILLLGLGIKAIRKRNG